MGAIDNVWSRIVKRSKDIDAWRKFHMAFAEWVDAWRVIPRLIVMGYAYICWETFQWYVGLKPYMIEGCDVETLKEACLVNAPTTEHMAFITALFGVSAGIFGLYTATGRKWNGFTHWNRLNERGEVILGAQAEEKS